LRKNFQVVLKVQFLIQDEPGKFISQEEEEIHLLDGTPEAGGKGEDLPTISSHKQSVQSLMYEDIEEPRVGTDFLPQRGRAKREKNLQISFVF